MSISADINSIVKIKKIKQGLPALGNRAEIPSSTSDASTVAEDQGPGIESPVTLEVLTWDPAADITLSGGEIVKTAATAQITDANGTVILIDTIIYPPLTI